MVESDTTNTFNNKHWSNQEVSFDFNADLTGTGGPPVCIYAVTIRPVTGTIAYALYTQLPEI